MKDNRIQNYGLLISGESASGVFTEVEYGPIKRLADAEILGFTEAYDRQNLCKVHAAIKSFFEEADPEATLYLYLLPKTTSLSQMLEQNGPLESFLETLGKDLEAVGLLRTPPSGYVSTLQDGLDQDIATAAPLAQTVADAQSAQTKPLMICIGAYGYSGQWADLFDYGSALGLGYPNVQVLLSSDGPLEPANVGRHLGRISAAPMGQSVAYPHLGQSQMSGAWLIDGYRVHADDETSLSEMSRKGYQFYRRYKGRNGIYPSPDKTLAGQTESFPSLHEQLLVQSAIRRVHRALAEELAEVLKFDQTTGLMEERHVAFVKTYLEAVLMREFVLEKKAVRMTVSIDASHDYFQDPKIPIALDCWTKPIQGPIHYIPKIKPQPRRGAL